MPVSSPQPVTLLILITCLVPIPLRAEPNVFVGEGPGWRPLTLEDFEQVNCPPETWTTQDGVIHCTGSPIGVIRSRETFTNLELVVEWRHLTRGGNSGIFLWVLEESLTGLTPGKLPPGGIEVQILDPAYVELYEERTGQSAAGLFTGHGDVFSVGTSKIQPFPPASLNGRRSFPTEERTRPANEWNHYYVRAMNGEVRLWVNGKEVSGGTNAQPASGYFCLESEGAPVEFRNLRVRALPGR